MPSTLSDTSINIVSTSRPLPYAHPASDPAAFAPTSLADAWLDRSGFQEAYPHSELAAYLILILANYSPPVDPATLRPLAFNPFRHALLTFQDKPGSTSGATDAEHALPAGTFTIAYPKLVDALLRYVLISID